MNAFTLKHVLLCQTDTDTFAHHDAEISKWINVLLIASSTDELNIRVNNNFELLPIIEQGDIVRLKLIIGDTLFISEAVFHALNTWLKQFSQEGPSKTVG